jgi:hypothetical protein
LGRGSSGEHFIRLDQRNGDKREIFTLTACNCLPRTTTTTTITITTTVVPTVVKCRTHHPCHCQFFAMDDPSMPNERVYSAESSIARRARELPSADMR